MIDEEQARGRAIADRANVLNIRGNRLAREIERAHVSDRPAMRERLEAINLELARLFLLINAD